MIWQKKIIFCLLLIQITSPLIKDSDEDSECADNDTEQLIVIFSKRDSTSSLPEDNLSILINLNHKYLKQSHPFSP